MERQTNKSAGRQLGLWRNGSASDSRSEGWAFESLWPHLHLTQQERSRIDRCIYSGPWQHAGAGHVRGFECRNFWAAFETGDAITRATQRPW